MATATAEIARVNGIELGYQTFGSGDPLILLHGGFGSADMFGPNLEALAAGRQVIGVDLQSHGRTPVADRPMRFETMADDVAALIGHLGFEKANVMGFSLGGGVTLRDYDWSSEIPGLQMPVMLVIGDADGLPPSHAVEFFGLLGGGRRDANWDRSGMTQHRLAILPDVTHYDINVSPALSQAIIPFLD